MASSQRRDIDLGITRFERGDNAAKKVAVLQIETRKHYNGGLISDASVFWVGDYSRSQLLSFGADGGDYSKRLKVSSKAKATQKAIDSQHAEVFTDVAVDALVDDAKGYYAVGIRAGKDSMGNTYEIPTE